MKIINAQIFIMAGITLLCSWMGWGALLYYIGYRNKRLIRLSVLMLPFSSVVNLLVKSPLNHLVVSQFHLSSQISLSQPWPYLIFLAFLPPVTEELIKIFPLLLPEIRAMSKQHAMWVGAWSGLGFGVGELLFLAWGISITPAYAGFRWYAFTGFFGERMIVCLIHAMITALFFVFIQKGKAFLGFLFAVILHLGVNSGAILISLTSVPAWVASTSLLLMFILLVLLFERQRKLILRSGAEEKQNLTTIYFTRKKDEKEG